MHRRDSASPEAAAASTLPAPTQIICNQLFGLDDSAVDESAKAPAPLQDQAAQQLSSEQLQHSETTQHQPTSAGIGRNSLSNFSAIHEHFLAAAPEASLSFMLGAASGSAQHDSPGPMTHQSAESPPAESPDAESPLSAQPSPRPRSHITRQRSSQAGMARDAVATLQEIDERVAAVLAFSPDRELEPAAALPPQSAAPGSWQEQDAQVQWLPFRM